MSLLEANGYRAVFRTPEGDTYHMPLVCWREEGDHVHGMVLFKGHLRNVEQLPNFLQYGARGDGDASLAPSLGVPEAGRRPGRTRTPALR